VAGEVAALGAARERIAPLRDAADFRSALEVSLDPLDGPAELEAKIAIIDGERLRISTRLADLAGEELVLAMRLQAKRQWARELGAARREAGGGVELLEQVHERTEAAVRSLTARVDAIGRERARLQASDSTLAATRREAEQRLRSIAPRQESR
jgi:chromosome segregation ATPase